MKRKLIGVLSVLILFSVAVCVFAGCKKAHTHDFGEWAVVSEATCDENGVRARKCKGCNKTERAEISATGHTYGEFVSEVPSTCVAEGVKAHYECSVCHKYFDENHAEIADTAIAKAHVLNFVKGKAATCIQDGIKDVYRCSVCRVSFDEDGNVVEDTVIPAKGHTFGELTPEVSATATKKGVKAHKDCSDCKLHFDADGNELASIIIPATEHTYSDWIEETPATCTVDGEKAHYECSHCDLVFDENYDVIEDPTIAAAHELTFSAWLAPTCEEDGHIAMYTCKNCSVIFDENKIETKNYRIAALGHHYGEWVEETPATCTEDGVKAHKTCGNCKENFDENDEAIDIKIPASHNFTRVAEKSATCTESGSLAYDGCSVCGKNFDVFGEEISDLDDIVIPAKNHAYGEWINSIDAECAEAGLIGHYHCRICDKDYDKNGVEIAEVIIPALGHNFTTEEIIPQEDPTCLKDGYVAHFECVTCGKNVDENGDILENIVIEMTGHEYGDYISGKEPTCTEAGKETHYVCGTCGDKFPYYDNKISVTDENLIIPSAGHKYSHFERAEATCYNTGLEEYYYCGSCGKYFNANKAEVEYDDLEIPHVEHVFGDWTEGREATETEDGIEGHYQCKKCLDYFDKDECRLCTIVIPKTVHDFEEWVTEISPTCTTEGKKGYFRCTHCDKYFDADYHEITDELSVPARHNVGELTPVSQGKCNDEDILVAYYRCNDCYQYLDEDMNVLKYNDIFCRADRHDYIVLSGNDWVHERKCRDCGQYSSENHKFEFSYITENNVPMQKGTCKVCGYENIDTYYVVKEVGLPTDIYIGYHTNGTMLFRIRYRDGSSTWVHTGAVMNEADAERFEKILDSSAEGFTERSETFTISYMNFTEEVEITFRPYVVYGVVTGDKVYQKGEINDLNDVDYLYDCNYTRDTGNTVLINFGDVIDDGGFDADFDFAASGLSEKTFTVKYRVDGIEYDVAVTLVDEGVKKPAYIDYGDNDYLLLGETLRVDVTYSDKSIKTFTVTSDMIIKGSFDSSVLGKQTITVKVEGIVQTIVVNVRDPYEVGYMYVMNDVLPVGEKLTIEVRYLNDDYEIIEVTPDMIEGVFDNNAAGEYEITVVYEGYPYPAVITVFDPDDSRVSGIETVFGGSMVWDVNDGKIVENLDYLYIKVNKNDNEIEYVKVTEDMISYDKDAAESAINDGRFILTITYYGKTFSTFVAPRDIDGLEVDSRMFVFDKTDLALGSNPTMHMKDGDLSNYFVRLSTDYGYYCLPVTEDMFYQQAANGTLVPFDFASAENGEDYFVTLKYGEAQSTYFDLLKYTESDIEYFFDTYKSVSVAVGTKEQVFDRLAGTLFALRMSVCGHSFSVSEFYFEDLMLAPNDDVDFSTPGYAYLTASYKGTVGSFAIGLIPDVEGVRYVSYKISRSEMLTLYENGYASIYDRWGEYSCVNEQLNLYAVTVYGWNGKLFFALNGNSATVYTAEMLEDNLEIYHFLFNIEGLSEIRVYTKNGFSLADLYDTYGNYETTASVTFSRDGKRIYINDTEYTIDEDNILVFVADGNVVYRFIDKSDESYMKGTLNDNGNFYLSMVETDLDGKETEYIVAVFEWQEKDGIVKIYSNGQLFIAGEIVDGFLVIEYA